MAIRHEGTRQAKASKAMKFDNDDDMRPEYDFRGGVRGKFHADRNEPVHPLQAEFGFTRPEDGSQDRYVERHKTVPWAKHTVWWVIHNAMAHPLIAVLPVRFTFRFHDWTSRKMHGR